MKRYILMTILFGLLFPACIHNNGDIGPLYGLWRLEEVNHNSASLHPERSYFLGFQAAVTTLRYVNPNNMVYDESYGSFKEQGDSITLHFLNGSTTLFKNFLFEDNPARFKIEHVGKQTLVLSQEGNKWYFEKHD